MLLFISRRTASCYSDQSPLGVRAGSPGQASALSLKRSVTYSSRWCARGSGPLATSLSALHAFRRAITRPLRHQERAQPVADSSAGRPRCKVSTRAAPAPVLSKFQSPYLQRDDEPRQARPAQVSLMKTLRRLTSEGQNVLQGCLNVHEVAENDGDHEAPFRG